MTTHLKGHPNWEALLTRCVHCGDAGRSEREEEDLTDSQTPPSWETAIYFFK